MFSALLKNNLNEDSCAAFSPVLITMPRANTFRIAFTPPAAPNVRTKLGSTTIEPIIETSRSGSTNPDCTSSSAS